jgi:DNA polymerase-3 subunit gamma/tau
VAEATSSALSEPIDIQNWPALIEAAKLRGPVGQLAQHAAFIAWEGNTLRLALKTAHEHLNTPVIMEKMQQQLEAALKRPVKLRFEKADAMAQTPADSALLLKSEQQRGAQENLNNDPLVQSLMQNFGARIIPESIKPMEKEA